MLCLGVGSGEETEYYQQLGAKRITGIDASKRLIEAANHRYTQHNFQVMDMENLSFPDQSFDLVVSSLAMHYLPGWQQVLSEVNRVLKPGGVFVFSTHHPIYWSAQKVKTNDGYERVIGYRYFTKNRELKVYGRYLESNNITSEIISGLEVSYYHRPLSELINDALKSPLSLAKVLEPKPLESVKQIDGNFFRRTSMWPPFIIFKLQKV